MPDYSGYKEHELFPDYGPEEQLEIVRDFEAMISARRSIREFDRQPVDQAVIEYAIKSAGAAPSGANLQPWMFVAVSDPELKKKIRSAAENEEREFYENRIPDHQASALAVLGTDAKKEFLEDASHLIVVFSKLKETNSAGDLTPTYYPIESTCIAAGFLIAALHSAGLGTLTHTPSPMRFLNEIFDLESYYRALVVVAAGYPKRPVKVSPVERKGLEAISRFI